nr:unnamed protein product [Digitaria exilis]
MTPLTKVNPGGCVPVADLMEDRHHWASSCPFPDAPRRLHLVELRPNAKGLSSLAQAPAASPQTRLEGLARLQALDYNTWCVQAPMLLRYPSL